MMDMLPVLLIPFVVGGIAYSILKLTVTWKELLLMEGICTTVVVIGFLIARYAALTSTEHWNGHITKKTEDTISCCHCTTVCDSRDSKGTCTRSHERCDHISDSQWNLHVSTGDVLMIDTCDGWGSPPKAWADARVGEFAAVAHSYKNYLKADPDTLLAHGADEELVEQIPDFPEIHEHYRVSKVVTDGAEAPKSWQPALEKINDEFGERKQIDVVFLLTKHKDPNAYAAAVEVAWLYGPKNSLTVVMGTDGDTITWARIMTISRVELLKVELRNALEGLSLENPMIFVILREQIERHWERTAMDEYSYLASHASPSTLGMVFLYLIATVLSIGLAVYMHNEDIFGDEGYLNRHSLD